MRFTDLPFERLYGIFSHNMLAVCVAHHLLKPQPGRQWSADQIAEINRELRLAGDMASTAFQAMYKKGIPEEMLSLHLQPHLE